MAVSNSLVKKQAKTSLTAYLTQQCGWRKERNEIHFQYCVGGTDDTGIAGMYEPVHFKCGIIRRGTESVSFTAARTVLYGAF